MQTKTLNHAALQVHRNSDDLSHGQLRGTAWQNAEQQRSSRFPARPSQQSARMCDERELRYPALTHVHTMLRNALLASRTSKSRSSREVCFRSAKT